MKLCTEASTLTTTQSAGNPGRRTPAPLSELSTWPPRSMCRRVCCSNISVVTDDATTIYTHCLRIDVRRTAGIVAPRRRFCGHRSSLMSDVANNRRSVQGGGLLLAARPILNIKSFVEIAYIHTKYGNYTLICCFFFKRFGNSFYWTVKNHFVSY